MSSQSIQTFELEKGRTFVSGLMWQTLSSPKNMMAESRELASELDFDLMVYREGLMPQVGLASTADGAKEGFMSLAAIVSKFHEDDGKSEFGGVLCAIPIPDGRFLLVAMRDGAILPDGDIIGDEYEIEEQFNQLLSLSASEWGIRVAPSRWGVEGAVERDFQFYIPKKKNGSAEYHSWWELRSPVGDRKRATKKFLIAAVIAVMIACGITGVKKYQEYQEQQGVLERQAASDQAKQTAVSGLHAEIPTPWKDAPVPALTLMTCESHYSPKYLFAGGWMLRDFSCASRSATYIWSRGSTSFPSLRATIPAAIPSDLEDSASVTIPFSFASPPPADIGNISDVKPAFIRKMQSIDIKFNLVAVPVVLTSPPDAPADFVLPPPGYESYQWEIPGTPLSPRTMAGLIDGKSMRVSSVIARTGGPGIVEWSYKGEMYGKN